MEDPRQCKVDVAALTGLTDAQRNVAEDDLRRDEEPRTA